MNLGVALGIVAMVGATSARAQELQAEASLPYAFHGWNTLGYSAEVGYLFDGRQLVGVEWTYFDSTVANVYPAFGELRVAQQIQALQAVYRYSFPLMLSEHGGLLAPLELFLGTGAGLGRVRQSLPNMAAALSVVGEPLTAENTEISGELTAGVIFNVAAHFGIKAGFRYIDSFNNVRQFGADVNTDTKALEIGAVYRF